MNSLQRKYLMDRLAAVHIYSHKNKPQPPEPKEVKEARKIISKWNTQERRLQNRFYNRIRKAINITREKIFGDDYEQALRHVKKVENFK